MSKVYVSVEDTCPACKGKGVVEQRIVDSEGGDDWTYKGTCPKCWGEGDVQERVELQETALWRELTKLVRGYTERLP